MIHRGIKNNSIHQTIANKRRLGYEKEQLAARYLQSQGYQLLEQNYFTRYGEIDLIAKEKEYLVFLEVKYRKNTSSGYPEEAVTYAKQCHMIRAARYYMLTHGWSEYTPCRFDIVAITGNKIRLIRNAFEVTG